MSGNKQRIHTPVLTVQIRLPIREHNRSPLTELLRPGRYHRPEGAMHDAYTDCAQGVH